MCELVKLLFIISVVCSKFYAINRNFTRPPVPPVPTNMMSATTRLKGIEQFVGILSLLMFLPSSYQVSWLAVDGLQDKSLDVCLYDLKSMVLTGPG